jgi:cytochrome c6
MSKNRHHGERPVTPHRLHVITPPHQSTHSQTVMKSSLKITALSLGLLFAGAISQAAPAAENWENNCMKCHGADGKGETKIGKKLKLQDYTNAEVQAKMTDEAIVKAITEGVTEGDKEKMKSFKDVLTKEEITDLVAYVRKFKS